MAEPVRRCAGCGRKAGKSEFIRIVKLPCGDVVFDPGQAQQGRSLHFCPEIKCFKTLMRRRAPEKLMKVQLPAEVQEAIIRYLSQAERA